jgi:uncharacterized protein YuzE
MMKMHYAPEADAFAVQFAPKGAYVESEEVAPGVTLDFDADGQVIGIEVLDVRKRMVAPARVEAPVSVEKSAAE